jgi:2-dehydropantoate 2-reductase
MRAPIGDIERAGASDLALALLAECSAIAASQGFAPRPAVLERGSPMLTMPGSTLTASMMKDIERGARTEADHIIGDLLARRKASAPDASLLRIVYAHLRAYEARREREANPRTS